MEKLYDYIKDTFVSFKLDTCCCVAPIRIGLLGIGYLNIAVSLLSIVGTADDGYPPPLMQVQAINQEGEFSKPLGIVAYATEMAFNMVLLCGIYRNDITLLRVYIYFVVVSIISSVLVYSIVFMGISGLLKTIIIFILAFQCYVIILVRSMIVEIKETRTSEKNGHVTLYSVVRVPDEVPAKVEEHPDTEIIVEPAVAEESQTSKKDEHEEIVEDLHPEQKKDESPSKLETIKEHLKDN